MNRCDFSSISTCLKNHISESNQMSQPDFLYELFEDFMDDPANQDFSMDNGLVCRWMTGQAKISPKISAYYSKPSNQEKLAHTIHQNLLPLMSDCNMAIEDIYTLFIQDDSISDAKKKNLTPLYKPASSRLLFLAKLISFGMERQFIKRNTKNQKLLAGGALSPIVLDYIMDSEVPKPCRHFIGRDKELEELYTMLEENRHVFLCGIAGIGKSELAKAYAKHYKKHYTNILYVEYTGDLHQDITDMDFIDDPPEISEQERFQRHNRFLRSLKSDTLLIIDNFNVTSTQDSCLSVVLKYRCRVLFTTRSQLSEYCSFQLKELKDIPTLFQLTSVFYSEAEENRAIVEKIIETVHYHTFAVELAAKLLENGILTPEQLLIKLQEEKASLHNEDKIKVIWDIQQEALSCSIVKISLQPLVENAVYHGIKPLRYQGIITIRAYEKEKKLIVEVEDNGIGMEESECRELNENLTEKYILNEDHIGIRNVNQRLKLLLGDETKMQVISKKGEGTKVCLILPFQTFGKREQEEK